MTIKLELTVDETNAVLGWISRGPFNEVAGLIDKIRSQALPQYQAMQTSAPAQVEAPAPSEVQ